VNTSCFGLTGANPKGTTMRKSLLTIGMASLAAIGSLALQAPAAHAAGPDVTVIKSGTGKVLRVVMFSDVLDQYGKGGGDRLEYWGSGNCSSTSSDMDYGRKVIPTGWNDRISAWKDYAGCDVQFFKDGGFEGKRTYVLNAGSKGQSFGPNWNDKVSSFKVT
jgi:hypothetical protein